MAGHNKWSKIKRKKAANDVARHREHTRATRAIETASRLCKGDMADIHLQSTISAARAVQCPKERIERAIERGANPNAKSDGEDYVVRRYDGMIAVSGGSGTVGKVAVIIETLTENKNRTAANVRNIVKKAGGEVLPTGTNDWMFDHVGLIWIAKQQQHTKDGDVKSSRSSSIQVDEKVMDALLECALEGGATDVEFLSEVTDVASTDEESESNNYAMVKCEPNDVLQLIQRLQTNGYAIPQFEKQWLVKEEENRVVLDKDGTESFEKFLNAMDDDLDVTNVFHNASLVDDDT
jgi:transcriptional/translational regulatory protein YebC/TACO1